MDDAKVLEVIDQTGGELVERTAADQHPVSVYLGAKAPGSRRAIRQRLDAVAGLLTGGTCDADSLPWHGIRNEHMARVQRMLLEAGRSAATVNATMSAVKAVLRQARRLKLIDAETLAQTVDIDAVKGSPLPAGRNIDRGEVLALVRTCAADPSPAGARDGALLALFSAGLRRAELVALRLEDFDTATGCLRVLGAKGGKDRTTYLSTGARAAIGDWLEVRGAEPGALVCPVSKAGTVTVRHLSAQAVYAALDARRVEAGVAEFSPHDFRRSFIGDLLDAGVDLVTVAHLVGHAKVDTTRRYDRRGERAKQDAVGRANFPHIARVAA